MFHARTFSKGKRLRNTKFLEMLENVRVERSFRKLLKIYTTTLPYNLEIEMNENK